MNGEPGTIECSESLPEDLDELDEVAARLTSVGKCVYDTDAGWVFDQELLELWGAESAAAAMAVDIDLVLPDESADPTAKWGSVVLTPGERTFSYRIIHGRTSELRHLQCTCEAVFNPDGGLSRAVATHVDVTDTVLAREVVEHAKAETMRVRAMLLRQVGDALATNRGGPEQLMESIANLASVVIGEGAVIRVLTPDRVAVENDVVAHPHAPTRTRITTVLQRSAPTFRAGNGIAAEVVGRGKSLSTRNRDAEWLPQFHRQFCDRTHPAEHVIIAPARHNGIVLAMVAVFRTDPDAPYESTDEGLLQVLADGAGSAIAESRMAEQVRERADRLQALTEQQEELLDQLATIETSERSLIAEVIHDEPIQLVVAALMRLDLIASRPGVPRSLCRELDAAAELLEAAVDRMRNLIAVGLSPPNLTDGLGIAVSDLAQGIFAGTTVGFTVTGPEPVDLNPARKEAAYRILREALINVRKHAKATTVTLRLHEDPDRIVLRLSDDGVGTESLDAGAGHLGLSTMRTRADAEGGNLHIHSTPGAGTTVELTLPKRLDQPPTPRPARQSNI